MECPIRWHAMNTATRLQEDALGLAHSVVMGVAGTAPSFSISATLAALIGAVGILAPASLLYCGLIMFGITFAFAHLNRLEASAGASYAWVSRIFNDTLGFFAGWSLLVASALFMVSATLPAANATLLLVWPEQVDHMPAVTAVAVAWLLVVSVVLVRGVVITGAVQTVMTSIELAVLALLVVTALVKLGPAAWERFSWRDFSPLAFSPSSFASGAMIALFFFWGWDVALNLTEETKDARRTPGLGAVVAMIILVGAFVAFTTVALLALGPEAINASSTNILFALADSLLPRPWSYLGVLALVLSTIGTLETSILQFSRTLYAKARDGALHARYARLHPRWRTPYVATLVIAGLGVALLVTSLLFRDLKAVLTASINAIGVMCAYYYGLAGFACAWHFRHQARSARALLFQVIWPAAGAAVLWTVAFMTLAEFDLPTTLCAVGGMALGFVPLTAQRRAAAQARG